MLFDGNKNVTPDAFYFPLQKKIVSKPTKKNYKIY